MFFKIYFFIFFRYIFTPKNCAFMLKNSLTWIQCTERNRDGNRSNHREVFLEKVVLKICSKFTGKQPCRSAISINLPCNSIEITPRHGCSPVNLLHIFKTPIVKNTSGRLLLFLSSRIVSFLHASYLKYTFNKCVVKNVFYVF